HLPFDIAGLRIERNQAPIDSAENYFPLIERDAAVDYITAGLPADAAIHLRVEVPQLLAGTGVERKHAAPRTRGIQHAIVDQWRGFEAAVRTGIEGPRHAELGDVVPI